MAVSAEELIAQVRLTSGLRNNRVITDAQILVMLNDAFADLRDRMITKFAYWFRATHDFTLAGGAGGNVLDLTLVPRLEMVQGLDLLDSDGNAFTVEMLPSFANRNQGNAAYPMAVGWSFSGFAGRRYWIDGDSLFVYPAANAAGSYRLIYTPMQENMQPLVTVDWTLGISASASDNGGIRYEFGSEHPVFVDAMLGGTLVVTVESPNTAFTTTGTVITGPEPFSSGNVADTDLGWPGAPTGALVGTASITYQPADTIASLPQNLTPWARYLVLYASRVVRTEREQPTADIDLQLAQIEQRIAGVTKQRSEGVRQAPRTGGYYGGGWGGGR